MPRSAVTYRNPCGTDSDPALLKLIKYNIDEQSGKTLSIYFKDKIKRCLVLLLVRKDVELKPINQLSKRIPCLSTDSEVA